MTDNPIASATMMRLAQEVGGMRTDLGALTQGLLLMLETQRVQSAMLQEILNAAQPPDDEGENPVAAALRAMTATVRDLVTSSDQVTAGLGQMTNMMSGAVLRGARVPVDADV